VGQAQNPVSPGTQQLNETTSATADGNGNAVFKFESPPSGKTWTGTLTCAGAPVTAIFLATIGATSWGDWAGNSVAGPVQCFGSGAQQLVVTATGLTPNTTFALVWAGSSDDTSSVQPIFPDANSSAVAASIAGVVSQSVDLLSNPTPTLVINVPQTFTFTAKHNYAGIMIMLGNGAGAPNFYVSMRVQNGSLAPTGPQPYVVGKTPPLDPVSGSDDDSNGYWFPVPFTAGQQVSITLRAVQGSGFLEVSFVGLGSFPGIVPVGGLPVGCYRVGGQSRAAPTWSVIGTQVPAMPAPPPGMAYALHLIMANTATTGYVIDNGTDVVGFISGPGSVALNGQLCLGPVTVEMSGGAGGNAYLTFDLVSLPVLT
jgi:hypothetical protein